MRLTYTPQGFVLKSAVTGTILSHLPAIDGGHRPLTRSAKSRRLLPRQSGVLGVGSLISSAVGLVYIGYEAYIEIQA
jgi:hypothetical protein